MIASILKLVTIITLSTSAMAKPVSSGKRQASQRRDQSFPSFNNFDGRSSLSNFDNFFGQNNFDGSNNQLVVFQSKQVVCQQVEVEVIQQRLTVLREFMKRILIEQVCEVETQTILFEQFNSGINSFGRDIRRQSNRDVTFDSSVSDRISQLHNSDGSLSNGNLGFQGSDVGRNGVVSSGSNWNSNNSPQSVGNIWNQAQVALNNSQNVNSSSPAITTSAEPSSTSSSAPAATNTK